MQDQQPQPAPLLGSGARPPIASQQTNNRNDNDANISLSLSQPPQRLSLHTPINTPLPQSPGLNSPLRPTESIRTTSSPKPTPLSIRRSSSVASLNRAQSPALQRKSSNSSMRSDAPGTPRGGPVRRPSFNPHMPSPTSAKSPLPPPQEEKPPLRACDLAEEHFRQDLERHGSEDGTVDAGTIVLVHDQCYGHRFARPKTTKTTLSLIMERPERILASVLGISAAYVRLGERHMEGNRPIHPDNDLPDNVPFIIRKTSRMVDITSQVVTNVHGTAWMNELKYLCDNAERRLATNGKELTRDPSVIPGQTSKQELHAGDLYLCPESMNAFQGALGGVLDAVDAVFQIPASGSAPSRAFVCIRPPGHHCSDDHPSGFCWLNNVHVGIEHAMMKYGVTHAAIIDFDLHHGDGSQAITWARNKKVQNMSKNTANWKKTSIGYFSLHDINSYPCEDGDDDKVQAASLCIDNAHGQSIWNVHLQPWSTPEEFWAVYQEKYLVLLEKTRLYLKSHTQRLRNAAANSTQKSHPAPKSVIFLSAGFDASEWETAGMQRHSVNVPTEFYARFTRDVVKLAEEEGTSAGGRVISVLEGGYSNRALTSGVLSHLSGLCDGQVYTEPKQSRGLAFDMQQRLGRLAVHDEDTVMQSIENERTLVTYDPQWWHASHLSELENLVEPPPPVAPRKPKAEKSAHFSSPTQSFVAKVVDPSKLHRTLSGRYTASPSRAPTPPPPEVDWATAAHALSKLLIPSDRQTRSHKPEELSEPRIKKEKPAAPAVTSAHVDTSGRQLRGRKAAPTYTEPDSGDEKASRAESRANRRKTIADFPLASTEPAVPARSASRRMSVASSVSSIGDRGATREPSVVSSRRSVAPSTTSNTGLPVKKSRSTATGPTGIARPTQRPPVPRVPSNYASKTAATKGKENGDMDALTSGLKRITLKMPSREEYEARERSKVEKQNSEPAQKPAIKATTTKKAPAARTSTAKSTTKAAAPKRGPGRPSKVSKPASPVEAHIPTPTAIEPPQVQAAASTNLMQPQPVQAEPALVVTTDSKLAKPRNSLKVEEPPAVDRRTSGGLMEPPFEPLEKVMTPEELREQLPLPAFMQVSNPSSTASPPARSDTPPPPPPSTIPQFVNYTMQTFGTEVKEDVEVKPQYEEVSNSMPLQWMPQEPIDTTVTTTGSRPLSPASKKHELPIFTANGNIPFASNPNSALHPTHKGPRASLAAGNQQGTAGEAKKEEKESDIWEIPITPGR